MKIWTSTKSSMLAWSNSNGEIIFDKGSYVVRLVQLDTLESCMSFNCDGKANTDSNALRWRCRVLCPIV